MTGRSSTRSGRINCEFVRCGPLDPRRRLFCLTAFFLSFIVPLGTALSSYSSEFDSSHSALMLFCLAILYLHLK